MNMSTVRSDRADYESVTCLIHIQDLSSLRILSQMEYIREFMRTLDSFNNAGDTIKDLSRKAIILVDQTKNALNKTQHFVHDQTVSIPQSVQSINRELVLVHSMLHWLQIAVIILILAALCVTGCVFIRTYMKVYGTKQGQLVEPLLPDRQKRFLPENE